MNNTEIIEKLAIIMDRLDRIERKVDELNKKDILPIPYQDTPTYPIPTIDLNKITCELIKSN